MSDIGPAGRATVLVCITCRAATDPTEVPRAGIALADATLARCRECLGAFRLSASAASATAIGD